MLVNEHMHAYQVKKQGESDFQAESSIPWLKDGAKTKSRLVHPSLASS